MSNETTLDDVLALVGKWRSLALDRDNGLDDYYKQALDACADELEDHGPTIKAALEDARRLDWLDTNGFTAYRGIDPIDGLSGHCTVVHETQRPRRGNVADTIRQAIDAAQEVGK